MNYRSILGLVVACIMMATPALSVSVDELSKTVVLLRQQTPAYEKKGGKIFEVWFRDQETKEYTQKIESSFGTGLLIRFNGRDYIVTAKHVAFAMSPSAEVLVNMPNGRSQGLPFGWIQAQDIVKGARWFHHPKVDLSIHPMAYPSSTATLSIPEELFPRKDSDLPLLSPAYVLGFPMGQGAIDKLTPIAKGTQIASRETSLDITTISPEIRFILLDQALAQGYSGAPVFYTEDILSDATINNQRMKAGERLHILGIQSSVIPDQTGGKMSLVVPVRYIWDILDSNEFRSYESGLSTTKRAPNQAL